MVQPLTVRRSGGRKRWWLISLASLLAIGSEQDTGPFRFGPPPVSMFDRRLEPLRTASARWEVRQGPDRQVVDQVCLVPDLATFFEAISRWDRASFYPILIEDAESTLRFLRAFHPSRIVRIAATPRPIRPGQTWSAANSSVRASWREPGSAALADEPPLVVRPPESLGLTPPGLVLSHPDAPMLAGAVALAAGRFQPLVRLESGQKSRQTLPIDEFQTFDQVVTDAVARVTPSYGGLGDDCDFLTVAGDYPYRYHDSKGEVEAVDDALGRGEGGNRWAYAGRLLGDPAQSVYRAMCSLFLQPDSASFFNGYDESTQPWASYSTRGASLRLSGTMSTKNHGGPLDGTVAGWFAAFDPENRSSLVWVNSHGSPSIFHLQDVEACTADIPRTVPSAVVMIHSFSAVDPADPTTIAGRWLSNGAFVYFGSINEPFLQAFRTPTLVVDLLVEHLPLVAVLRNTAVEPYGGPWRLEYLGDPLFRIKPRRFGVLNPPESQSPDSQPRGVMTGRISAGEPPPAGLILAASDPGAVGREKSLPDAVDAAFILASRREVDPHDPAVAATVARFTDIDRDSLDPAEKRIYDSVLADLLFAARRRGELRARIEMISPEQRSPELARWLDAILAGEFAWIVTGGDFHRIVTAWDRIIRTETASVDFRRLATARVGAVTDDPDRRDEWTTALREALVNHPSADYLKAELKRVEIARQRDQVKSR